MDKLKPRITLAGFKKALSEYGNEPNRVVEELVANSYDADSTEVAIIYSSNSLMVVDNGIGILNSQFPKLLDLGAGTKVGAHDSRLRRSYLGSFGFGIKSTVNIARSITIATVNSDNYVSTEIDVGTLGTRGFDDEWDGFAVAHSKGTSKPGATGTLVSLELRNDLTEEQIEGIKRSLYNLPKSKDFRVYFVHKRKAGRGLQSPSEQAIKSLQHEVKAFRKDKISGILEIGQAKIQRCNLAGTDAIDVSVWCNGLDSAMKVKSLGQLAGVYIKVDGRVLKRNFQGEKILDGVSKYPKFKHGMRIEIPIDWLKEQISLGRDGLQFGNESSRRKFENELKLAVTAAVRPFAKMLETHKSRAVAREVELRMKKARERIRERQSIRQLESTGYSYVPRDDYEMALLIANPSVLRLVNKNWVLMDFNGQQDFDCLVYDKSADDFIRVELEPELETIRDQNVLENTEFVVTWTRGDWKVGKSLKARKGYIELHEDKDGPGHYKLLIKPSLKSKEIRQTLPVFCLDKAFKISR